jgi:hypothetical protein
MGGIGDHLAGRSHSHGDKTMILWRFNAVFFPNFMVMSWGFYRVLMVILWGYYGI